MHRDADEWRLIRIIEDALHSGEFPAWSDGVVGDDDGDEDAFDSGDDTACGGDFSGSCSVIVVSDGRVKM